MSVEGMKKYLQFLVCGDNRHEQEHRGMHLLPQKPIVSLRVPVLTIILAATAFPVGFRPIHQFDWHLFSNEAIDTLQNIAGFVPVGFVLAGLGPMWAVITGGMISILAETSQLVMLYRTASLADVATNLLGTILGVILAGRCNLKPQFIATKGIGAAAAVLAVLLIFGVWYWKLPSNWLSYFGTTTAGMGDLEAHWAFDDAGGRIALDSSGNGLHGTFQSEPKWVASPMGGAIEFDGPDDFINLAVPQLFGSPAA